MQNFEQLLKQFSTERSLQDGNDQIVRYNVYTSEGKRALELYEIGVSLMKERSAVDQGDPFGWVYQAGIHGNFWRNVEELAQWSAANNYQFTSEEAVLAGNTVLNNCTHYNNQWSNVAIPPGTDMEVNFAPWHRLYLQSFESIIRELLSQESIEGAENWGIPYWQYTNAEEGVIPSLFRDTSSSLYELSRGVRVNDGESVKEQGVLKTIQKGLIDSSEQTSYASFNSLLDNNPHGFMHDYLGGSQDSPSEQAKTGAAQQAIAEQLGAGDADDIGVMGLMANVASAALDPIFYIHHSYIDKIWSDWNASENATFINESLLEKSPWNYQYFTPSNDGNVQLETYSYWGDDPKSVLSAIYNPNYTYDNSRSNGNAPNPVLSLIQHPDFRPLTVKKQIDRSAQKVQSKTQAIQPINLDLSLNYRDIADLSRDNNINLEINLDYTIPMDSSTPFRVIFWDFETLNNPKQLEELLEEHAINELPGFTIVPFAMGGATPMSDQGMNNGMPMNSNDMMMDSNGMMMTMGASIDLTYAFNKAGEAVTNLIQDSPLGMIAISSDSSEDISIKELAISLNQNLNKTNINGNTFDNAGYLAEYPDLLNNPLALEDPYEYFQTIGKEQGDLETTIEDRAEELGFGYLAANCDLVNELNNSPYHAIAHYLDQGLEEGRSLLPTSGQSDHSTDCIIGPQAFRLYNGLSGERLTSASSKEIYFLLANEEGWRNEETSFQVGGDGADQSIFRFINEKTGGYYYSANKSLDPNLKESGFLADSFAFEIFSESNQISDRYDILFESSNQSSDRVALIQYYEISTGQYLLSSSTDEQRMLENDANWIENELLGYVNPML